MSANILLVDDRPENLLALEAILGDLGNLIKASSGEEALRYLLKEDVAVILLDVQMPGMNGIETAKLVRKRDKNKDTPIILVTVFERSDSFMLQACLLNVYDFIFKPFIPEVLRLKVKAFIDIYNRISSLKTH